MCVCQIRIVQSVLNHRLSNFAYLFNSIEFYKGKVSLNLTDLFAFSFGMDRAVLQRELSDTGQQDLQILILLSQFKEPWQLIY